jgi:hypothetical protein
MTRVGVLGSPRRAEVDGRGAVTFGRGLHVDWIVGADDRWHHAVSDVAVRQRRVGPGPALETAMRVPSGDALQRVYGVGGPGDVVVVEVENASPAPFVLGLVVRGGRELVLDEDEGVVRIDGRTLLVVPRAPSRWAAGRAGAAVEVAVHGDATDAPLTRVTADEAVLLWPVTHRTRTRVALALGGDVPSGGVPLAALPGIGEVAAGWSAQLRRGMEVVLPDEGLQEQIDAARADALLAAAAGVGRGDAGLVVALEDWGFDAEAAAGWQRLGSRARREARRRVASEPWKLLHEVRERLVLEREDGAVELLRGFAPEWRGANLDVRGAPTRRGVVSYSVRWHGEHPALLWEVVDAKDPFALRAPVLDADWSTRDAAGETLLGVARQR